MKKDIEIPEVTGLKLAIVQQYNDTFKTNDFYAYLINEKEVDLEMILIVSKGSNEKQETSVMRHKIEKLPAGSAARIELIQEEVLGLDNMFKVSFFENNRMFEKDFLIPKGSLKEGNLRMIKALNARGVVF